MQRATPGGPAPRFESRASGSLRLHVRPAVAVRDLPCPRGAAFYLSLFEDEIGERCDELLRRFPQAEPGDGPLRDLALHLEPTDALVLAGDRDTVWVARGGACNFPLYWAQRPDGIHVSTSLPLDQDHRLSRAGLLDSLAVVAAAYRHEPNFLLRAPLAGWHRLRRGGVSRLAPGGPAVETLIDHAAALGAVPDHDGLVAAIRLAFDRFGARQRRGRPQAAIEFSGGLDSTLVAIAARNHGIGLHGASVHFPFYEFRYEEDIQRAAAAALGVGRQVIDGTTVHSFAPPDRWLRLDEPATRIMSMKRDQTMAQLAAAAGSDRVYVGEGGDELFAEDMLEPVPPPRRLSAALYTPRAWATVEETRRQVEANPALRRRSLLTFVYDARLDVPLKESHGTATRSPFTDLDLVRCGLRWAQFTRSQGARHGKRVLADAFRGEVPAAVLERRGKVSWDGVFARAYARHGGTILDAIEGQRAVFGQLGVRVPWLAARLGQLARCERTAYGPDDGEVFAAYAIATWLDSWGIREAGDCDWCD